VYCPQNPNRRQGLKYLDVSVTIHESSKTLNLNVLNRSERQDIAARIDLVDARAASIEAWELNHSDLKATHTFGDDRKVRPATRSLKVTPELRHPFPKHPLTILKVKLA
jgi:alpha-L-arabinofuranosidase